MSSRGFKQMAETLKDASSLRFRDNHTTASMFYLYEVPECR